MKECWRYDPTGEYFTPVLQGLRLAGGGYVRQLAVASPDGALTLTSGTMGLEPCRLPAPEAGALQRSGGLGPPLLFGGVPGMAGSSELQILHPSIPLAALRSPGLIRRQALPATVRTPDLCRSVNLIYISVQLLRCWPMSREIGDRHPLSDLAFS